MVSRCDDGEDDQTCELTDHFANYKVLFKAPDIGLATHSFCSGIRIWALATDQLTVALGLLMRVLSWSIAALPVGLDSDSWSFYHLDDPYLRAPQHLSELQDIWIHYFFSRDMPPWPVGMPALVYHVEKRTVSANGYPHTTLLPGCSWW